MQSAYEQMHKRVQQGLQAQAFEVEVKSYLKKVNTNNLLI
jgi:hypothetical protein